VAREIIMPRLSDSMEEGTILKWLVAAGDTVSPGDPIVEVETDKAVVTHEADEAATVLGLLAEEGTSVAVGAPIMVVGEAGETLPEPVAFEHAHPPSDAVESVATVAAASAGEAAVSGAATVPAVDAAAGASIAGAAPTGAASSPGGRVKASPLARRIAAELGVDLAVLVGSGPQGRVIRSDVEHAAVSGARAPARAGNGDGHAGTAPAPAEGLGAKGETTRHTLSTIQRTVARRMAESRATVPDIELRAEIDMTAAVALREQLREVAPDRLPSFNDLIVKAVALALREFPRVGGAYRDGQFETYGRINVGIAVAAPDALVVPTVFDADTKSVGEIAQTTRALAARVRDGSITPAELSGATFSISNLGMYGIDSFSAVINSPQAAILAVGALRKRAVVLDSGEIVARDTVNLALACDHRIVYGVDGAQFMARLRELLQAPLGLLL